MIGEYLQANAPDLHVSYIIKDSAEWPEFVDSLARTYGFDKITCPLIYTIEGTLIGDGGQFVEHIRAYFGKTLPVSKE